MPNAMTARGVCVVFSHLSSGKGETLLFLYLQLLASKKCPSYQDRALSDHLWGRWAGSGQAVQLEHGLLRSAYVLWTYINTTYVQGRGLRWSEMDTWKEHQEFSSAAYCSKQSELWHWIMLLSTFWSLKPPRTEPAECCSVFGCPRY